MPVTTRSQSLLLRKAESQVAPKPSKSQPVKSHDKPPQDSNQANPPHDSLPFYATETLWPCLKCSCRKGIFQNLVDSCLQCAHSMEDHGPYRYDPWYPTCDYVCKREELVAAVLQHARNYGVVVIRATPQVGKTTLLHLVGHHVAHFERDLEPVYLSWSTEITPNDTPYDEYLDTQRQLWQKSNAKIRAYDPTSRIVYLIDEAQGSYKWVNFWTMLRNHHSTRTRPLFVLVCVYGADGISHIRDPQVESQALQMHSLHRIELRPISGGGPCMLFRREEVDFVLQSYAAAWSYPLDVGVVDYLWSATDGHPGMIGNLLSHAHLAIKKGLINPPLSPNFFHKIIVQDKYGFMDWLSSWGRGIWSPRSENYVVQCLQAPVYQHLVLADIKKALKQVAEHPDGLVLFQKRDDAFAFCHKMGYLHTEQSVFKNEETKFTFASPLHRRVAHRRLVSIPERDPIDNTLSLRDTCTNAIARFSPGVLQNRRNPQSGRGWNIPEAAFQDEMYCCLNLELRCLPILSEYSHSSNGRIDFYVSDKKWGIEIMQCGSKKDIATHIARFAAGGRYEEWAIMDDYIILNFCPRSKLCKVDISDKNMKSHFFHVVIEPAEFAAEIYSHDKRLLQSLSLGEDRKRADAYHFLNAETTPSSPQGGTTSRERAIMEEVERKIQEIERERERKIQEVRAQMKAQVQRERLQREQGPAETSQAEDKQVSALRSGRKRKR